MTHINQNDQKPQEFIEDDPFDFREDELHEKYCRDKKARTTTHHKKVGSLMFRLKD